MVARKEQSTINQGVDYQERDDMSLSQLQQDAKKLILSIKQEDQLPLFCLPEQKVGELRHSLDLETIYRLSQPKEHEDRLVVGSAS